MYHHILIATDGSRLAEQAARTGVDLARCMQAQLVVLYVAPSYPMDNFISARMPLPDEVGRIEQDGADAADSALDRIRHMALAAQLDMRDVVLQSDHPAEAIVACAHKFGCDLIVLGSHGYRGIKRLLLGNTAQQVLSLSTVAVLVTR